MNSAAIIVALWSVLVAVSGAWPQQPENPVVGIFSSPLEECPPVPSQLRNAEGGDEYNACVFSYSVRLLEAQGARAVVFPWNASYEQQLELASKVNGVWLPGGGLWGSLYDEYLAAVTRLYQIAKDMNSRGDRFVLWGTCWGFEMLTIAASGGNRSVMTGGLMGMEPLMMSVNFTAEQPTSRMLGDATAPAEILDAMRFHNATLNWHRQGLLIETYESNPHLKAQMSALATTRTPSGRHTFVAAAEDRSGAAIYGIQFHPERPPFEFTRDQIGHTPRDIAVSHYFGRFITEGLRANNHSFPSPQDAEALRVAQWPLEDLGWGMRTYFVKDPPGSQRV